MAVLHGMYYPPKSAQRIEATLELGGVGCARLRAGTVDRLWTADQLEVSASLGGLPCSITFSDGSKFETPDDPAIAEWLREAGHGRRGHLLHGLERRWKWVVLSILAVVLAIALFFWVGLPAASGWIAARIPTAMKVETGRQAKLIIDKLLEDESSTDPQKIASIERDFAALQEMRTIPPPRPHLEIRGGGSIGPNALALPDGTVILTDEMIELAPDSTAICGVLAHELGHLYYDHAMQHVVRASSLPILVVLLTGDLGSGTSLVGTIPINLVHNGYSRDAEREADLFAVELMKERGLDPGSMADLFERLMEEQGDVPGWLSTHPASSERVVFFRHSEPAR